MNRVPQGSRAPARRQPGAPIARATLLGEALVLIALLGRSGWPAGALGGGAAMMVVGITGWLVRLARRARAALAPAADPAGGAAHQRVALSDLPAAALVLGPCGEIRGCNRAALDLLGRAEADLLGKTLLDPVFQTIDQAGAPLAPADHPLARALASRQPVRGAVIGVARADRRATAWLTLDLQPRLAPDGALEQLICTLSPGGRPSEPDTVLQAVSFAAARFLEARSWEQVMPDALARLGAAAGVSRVYVFANHPPEPGGLRTSQRFEWVAPGVAPLIDDPELQGLLLHAAGYGRWERALSQGQPIYGDVRSFPPEERDRLLAHAIDSIALVPIFAGLQWWGSIGFDQCGGERAWLSADIESLRAAAGILGAAIERERAEATLRENERRYRDLFAAARRQAQDLALLNQIRTALARELDPQTIFRIVVEAIAETFGYTQVSLYLIQDQALHIQHQVGYDNVIARIPISDGVSGRVVRTGQPVLLEDARSDPAFIGAIAGIASEICVPLLDQRQVVGILNVESTGGVALTEADLRLVLSISEHINIAIERARLYQQVRESERKYRSVVDSIEEVVFQIDPAGAWGFLNAAWTDITGYEVGATIGQPCLDQIHPDDQAAFQAVFAALTTRQQLYCQEELRLQTSARATRWVELCAWPSFDAEGALIGISGTLADITTHKRAEDERVALERKMLETQKLESLGVLAGGIAHDFNNLLMAILGNAEMALLDMGAADSARESIQQIQITARRAAELTGQMLAYAGKGRFLLQRIDLNLLVEEITVLLKVSIAKTTMLRYRLAAQLPLIEGDSAQIRQVVMNLVINAAEAVGEREGLITISTSARQIERHELLAMRLGSDLPLGAYVALEVSDTGAGMDEATLARIFDPFFTTKFTGRGLGLAAVQGIVRSHSGALDVRSAPGAGTTFTILLPAAAPQSIDLGSLRDAMPLAYAPSAAAIQQTLLVIDDESGVRSIMSSLLQRVGYQVLTAIDGRDGVELFHAHAQRVGAVLLDLMMPQMNGEETLRALREIRPDISVVIMSGYDEHDLSERFAGQGPIRFLQKPFSAQALYDTIDAALARE